MSGTGAGGMFGMVWKRRALRAEAALAAPTTESVDDYEGWVETAFLPSVKYAVVWDEARDGWRVLTLNDGGAFA